MEQHYNQKQNIHERNFEELWEWALTMKGKTLYYARTKRLVDEAAIFQTERERDAWVNAAPEDRIALTRKQAEKCDYTALNNPLVWVADASNPRIYWAR